MTAFLMIFWRFLNTLRGFPKIFQNGSEGQTNFFFWKLKFNFIYNFNTYTTYLYYKYIYTYKILASYTEGQTNVPKRFPRISENFRRCLTTAKDFRGRREDVSMIPNEFKYNLRDKLDISEIIDIFTCENIISFLSICYHSVYQWHLYNKIGFQLYWNLHVANKITSKSQFFSCPLHVLRKQS